MAGEGLIKNVAIAAGNAVLLGVRPGKYIARGTKVAGDAFAKYIQPSLDRLNGTRPPLITIARQNDADNAYIFDINDVEVIDFENEERKLEEAANKEIDIKEPVGFDDEKEFKLKEAQKILGEQRTQEKEADDELPEDAIKKHNGPFYNITLKIKRSDRNLTLGEIDFSDWEKRTDFEIIITEKNDKQKERPLEKTDSRYSKVLSTLKRLPKVLANGKNSPASPVTAIKEKSGFWIVNKWKTLVRGETVIQELASDEEHPFLNDDSFINGIVAVVASDRIRNSESKILDNYFETDKLSLQNKLNSAKIARKKLDVEVKQREASQKRGRWIAFGIVAAIVVVAVAAVVVSLVATGPIAMGIGVLAAGIFGFAKSKIFGSLRALGIGGLLTGAAVGYVDYKKEKLEIAKTELKEVRKIEQEAQEGLENLNADKLGAKTTLESIMQLRDAKSNTLDLSKKAIGSMGVKILCNFLCAAAPGISLEKQGMPTCKHLNLSHNNLGSEEVEAIIGALKNAPVDKLSLQTIDLGDCSAINFEQALLTNFTLTSISYTGPRIRAIEEQLVLNSYLQNPETPIDKAKITGLFGENGMEAMKERAIRKVRENFKITTILCADDTKISKEAKMIMKQNSLFMKLNSFNVTEKHDNSEEFFKAYMEALKIDPKRCTTFVQNTNGLKPEIKQKIQEYVAGNVHKLMGSSTFEDIKNLIDTIFVSANSSMKASADIVINILKEFQRPSIIKDELISNASDALTSALLLSLRNGTSTDEFKKSIVQNCCSLVASKPKTELIRKLNIINVVVPALQDLTNAKENKLKLLINCSFTSEADGKVLFNNFINDCIDTEVNFLSSFLKANQKGGICNENLKKFLKNDIKNGFAQLKRLSKEQVEKLLPYCFVDNGDGSVNNKKRTEFVANMISCDKCAQLLDDQSVEALIEESNFDASSIGKDLRSKAISKEELSKAELLDKPYQMMQQNSLIDVLSYPGLYGDNKEAGVAVHSSTDMVKAIAPEGFEQLKKRLMELPNLRQFDFKQNEAISKKKLLPIVADYISLVCAKNRMLDIIDYFNKNKKLVSKSSLHTFINYFHSDKAFENLSSEEQKKVQEFIKASIREDVSNIGVYAELMTDNKDKKAFLELLKVQFNPKIIPGQQEDTNIRISVISGLLEIKGLFDKTKITSFNKSIQLIIHDAMKAQNQSDKDFQKIITELKKACADVTIPSKKYTQEDVVLSAAIKTVVDSAGLVEQKKPMDAVLVDLAKQYKKELPKNPKK